MSKSTTNERCARCQRDLLDGFHLVPAGINEVGFAGHVTVCPGCLTIEDQDAMQAEWEDVDRRHWEQARREEWRYVRPEPCESGKKLGR
jgi:hypothetical protein